MAVRSQLLAIGHLTTTGATSVYVVPSGFRTIIKGISAYNNAAAFNRLFVEWYSGLTLEGLLAVTCGVNGGQDESRNVSLFQVIEEGHTLKVDCAVGDLYYVISGAELLL